MDALGRPGSEAQNSATPFEYSQVLRMSLITGKWTGQGLAVSEPAGCTVITLLQTGMTGTSPLFQYRSNLECAWTSGILSGTPTKEMVTWKKVEEEM